MRRLLGNLLLLVLSLLLGLALFEVLFRVLDLDYNPNPYWYYHPVLGWSQKPGRSYDYVVAGEKVHVEYNTAGFRDVEHHRAKPPGTKRIVVIGDSFSEAVEVNLRDIFHRRLERMLNDRDGGSRWEVINLGVGDFGNAQALIALREVGLAYSPDVVVGQIFPLNDVCNNSIRMFGLCKSYNDPYRPYFVETAGELRLTTAQPGRNFLRRKLVFFGILERTLLNLIDPLQHPPDEEKYRRRLKERGLPPLEPIFYTFVDDAEQIELVADAWRITELILEKTVAFARQHGLAYLALVIPFEARVGAAWESFASAQPPPSMIQDYPEKRLVRLFHRLGVPAVMMKEVFDRYPERFFPTRGGHLNPEAHRLTSEAVYQKLVEAGLVP